MKKTILITGGAGFIGVNAARHFLKKGWQVIVFDNFSRRGTEVNARLLQREFPRGLTIIRADIVKDAQKLARAVEKASVVLHLAAQVAVTTSITNPRDDFNTNILGTFNVLEAVRHAKSRPAVLYASTNKVYGALDHLPVKSAGKRYVFRSKTHQTYGIGEDEQLDFHSPYGCSKGSADQYVIDYSRIYGLNTVVFRQSCIYGPYQFGVEDQGWVAWFTIAAMTGRSLTLYGSGKQVRDVLAVEDLIDLYDRAIRNIGKVRGKAFNVGGGPGNTISLLELLDLLEKRLGKKIRRTSAPIRAGDQPIFVADVRKLKKALGWAPRRGIENGWNDMYAWLTEHEKEVRSALA